ncbi:MAG: hypothetical protein K8J09_08920, partial [Planctomycetes bacterium]|nr:hypothetical protein [Planctomycetota bacterium]
DEHLDNLEFLAQRRLAAAADPLEPELAERLHAQLDGLRIDPQLTWRLLAGRLLAVRPAAGGSDTWYAAGRVAAACADADLSRDFASALAEAAPGAREVAELAARDAAAAAVVLAVNLRP